MWKAKSCHFVVILSLCSDHWYLLWIEPPADYEKYLCCHHNYNLWFLPETFWTVDKTNVHWKHNLTWKKGSLADMCENYSWEWFIWEPLNAVGWWAVKCTKRKSPTVCIQWVGKVSTVFAFEVFQNGFWLHIINTM